MRSRIAHALPRTLARACLTGRPMAHGNATLATVGSRDHLDGPAYRTVCCCARRAAQCPHAPKHAARVERKPGLAARQRSQFCAGVQLANWHAARSILVTADCNDGDRYAHDQEERVAWIRKSVRFCQPKNARRQFPCVAVKRDAIMCNVNSQRHISELVKIIAV